MIAGSIARRYARALMGIGVDTKTYDAMGRQISALAKAMKESTELAEILANPVFPRADRQRVLEAVLSRLGASKVVKNFTLLLLERERLAALPDIARELNVMIDEKNGRVTALVTSATPLTQVQITQIKGALEKLSGKQVHIDQKQDPALLGGVVAKVGDLVYDGSVRTQLAQMRHSLAE
jgi:F-type H+-transporting ATPase subunit delta